MPIRIACVAQNAAAARDRRGRAAMPAQAANRMSPARVALDTASNRDLARPLSPS